MTADKLCGESAELTIILTLKDRPRYTLRLMRYLNRYPLPFQLLIADGGRCKRIESLLCSGRNFTNVKYRYVRFGYDESYKNYYTKLFEACVLVSTKYCVFADNDNFFSVAELQRGVEYLEGDESYSAYQGLTIGFRINNGSPYYGKSISFSLPLRHFSLDESHPLDRITTISSCNWHSFYCVQRTSNLKSALATLLEINPQSLYLVEFLLHWALIINGKVKCTNLPYLYRQFDVVDSSNDADSKDINLLQRILWRGFSVEIVETIDALATQIVATYATCSYNDARERLRIAFESHLSPTLARCLLKPTNYSRSYIRGLKRLVWPLKYLIQNAYWIINSLLQQRRNVLGGHSLERLSIVCHLTKCNYRRNFEKDNEKNPL